MNGVNTANRNAAGSCGQSAEGGQLVRFTNGCAGVSVKGTLVSIDPTADGTVIETPLTSTGKIMVIAEDGRAVGESVWVAIGGIAEVNFNDNVGVAGDYVRVPVAGDAAIAVNEEVEFTFTEAVGAVAGNISIKLPSLAPVLIAVANGDDHDAVATKVAAGAYAGWTAAAVNEVVTFSQTVAATTDGVSSMTPALTLVTATIAVNHVGKPAITPAAGVAVADPTLPAAGTMIGQLLESHTARIYADGVNPARVLLANN